MQFNEYQKLAKRTDQRTDTNEELNRIIPLLGMVGEIGSVASEHKKRLRDGQSYTTFNEKFKKELGDVLWYISILATDMGISLEEVAQSNLDWTEKRWDSTKNFLPEELYDENYPDMQKFPRELTIEFKVNSSGKVSMLYEGSCIGNELDDNAYEEDGYKFHDIFHLAFMAVLGWSPVIRALLKRKRKDNPEIDRIEDGARAIAIEEAISAMLYAHAEEHNFYDDISVVDYDILKTIQGMVRNLETKNISSGLWEQAILQAFNVYRQVKTNCGGKVYINLHKRTIEFV